MLVKTLNSNDSNKQTLKEIVEWLHQQLTDSQLATLMQAALNSNPYVD